MTNDGDPKVKPNIFRDNPLAAIAIPFAVLGGACLFVLALSHAPIVTGDGVGILVIVLMLPYFGVVAAISWHRVKVTQIAAPVSLVARSASPALLTIHGRLPVRAMVGHRRGLNSVVRNFVCNVAVVATGIVIGQGWLVLWGIIPLAGTVLVSVGLIVATRHSAVWMSADQLGYRDRRGREMVVNRGDIVTVNDVRRRGRFLEVRELTVVGADGGVLLTVPAYDFRADEVDDLFGRLNVPIATDSESVHPGDPPAERRSDD